MVDFLYRPFNSMEFRPNADGSVSTELERGVYLKGEIANVPSLWKNTTSGRTVDLTKMSDDQLGEFAAKYEAASGRKFPRFQSFEESIVAAKRRSASGGRANGPLDSGTEENPMISDTQSQMVARILGGDTRGRLLRRGGRGKTVRALQLFLKSQGYDIKADGIFGDETLGAVKQYQKSAGLMTDGKVGIKTFGAIRKGIEGSKAIPQPRPAGVSEFDRMDAAAPAYPMPGVMARPEPAPAPPPDIMRGANSPLLDPQVAEYEPEPTLTAPDFGAAPEAPPSWPQQVPSTYSITAPGNPYGAMSGMGNAFSNASGQPTDQLIQALLQAKLGQQGPNPAQSAPPMMAGQGGDPELLRALIGGR